MHITFKLKTFQTFGGIKKKTSKIRIRKIKTYIWRYCKVDIKKPE